MRHAQQLFLGIDVGTGGVRALAATPSGEVAAAAAIAFDPSVVAPRQDRHEQPPEAWWRAVCRATSTVIEDLAAAAISPGQLAAVAVDGTSGTLVVLDDAGRPLRPAIMYNDPRSAVEAVQLNTAAADFCDKLGYRFESSFALAKIAWLRGHEPEVFDRAARFVHQADCIQGRLTGQPPVADYSNALKTGYDLIDECWPAWIDRLLPVTDRLPKVVAPGTTIGSVSQVAAEQTGLPAGLAVVSGASDGTAACLASGVREPGDYNTTLGTTLVYKGISRSVCRHPQGLVYCHKLPGGHWLPGAAGNVGCEWITRLFAHAEPSAMDTAAETRLPSDCLAYPLVRTGERFPFLSETAEGFAVPPAQEPADRYAACLQGVALVERLGYQTLDRVAGTSGGQVFSTGGGSRSDVWMQCRADATGRMMHRPRCGQSAFGSAVLAAAATYYDGWSEAVGHMVRIQRTFTPDVRRTEPYDGLFERFCDELKQRGYL
ncbi:MAG: FGGY-family carbohydrate kinase [Pirellulales bacterium]|nr:FGGY-family carbohydrate kinase [Pirellulales bacterium]